MCGIVGAIAKRDVAKILLAGLQRLEYRGYDSAGMAVLNQQQQMQRLRAVGKVAKLSAALTANPLKGRLGIAHTRWATHGEPSEINAHPHTSENQIAVVHNGIIENHAELKQKLIQQNYNFKSDTDTEVIAHLIHYHLQQENNLLTAIRNVSRELTGAFALGIIASGHPQELYAVRRGSPLVIGVGIEENFIGSDQLALLPVTQEFIYLEEGDIAKLTTQEIYIENAAGEVITRQTHQSKLAAESVSKDQYRHFMQKEIFEQPQVLTETLEQYLQQGDLSPQLLGDTPSELLKQVKRIRIIACGTSYNAGLVGRDWIESITKIPCEVEIASEYRYRDCVVSENTLIIALSQSGETADTLAALRLSKQQNYLGSLAICNAPESSLAREADLVLLTNAGIEIGVAATKTFTAQLTTLLLLTLTLAKYNSSAPEVVAMIGEQLKYLPNTAQITLELDNQIRQLSQQLVDKQHALFLGRGRYYPIALEGALKLKEISYLHAEAYPAGELKHGPLALVDEHMPVIVIVPNNHLLDKLQSNIQEVQARGGQLYIFSDASIQWPKTNNLNIIKVPNINDHLAPIIFTIPLQLLAYH
ncbi:MAG: glutamine--fructose-6-phosphate transaminase (isomerizing), partial [Gammaproteobacteria bacterium]|nr:glutamine--fructose-6-phosphate transaminase (isomerizing) [Gammaproteobacteria bacterium]